MQGKTVLITGGTGGIGRAAAIGLASMGARVGITGRDRGNAGIFIGSLMHVVGLIAALSGAVGMVLRPRSGRVAEATP